MKSRSSERLWACRGVSLGRGTCSLKEAFPSEDSHKVEVTQFPPLTALSVYGTEITARLCLVRSPGTDMAVFCLLCAKRFQTQKALQQHMEVHAGMHSYICSHCERPFPSHTTLKRHLRSHTGKRSLAPPLLSVVSAAVRKHAHAGVKHTHMFRRRQRQMCLFLYVG